MAAETAVVLSMDIADMTREELQQMITGAVESAVHSTIQRIMRTQLSTQKDKWLSLDDALEYLSSEGCIITKSTLYKKISAGDIPYKKPGRRVAIRISDLKRFASEHPTQKSNLEVEKLLARSARTKLERRSKNG